MDIHKSISSQAASRDLMRLCKEHRVEATGSGRMMRYKRRDYKRDQHLGRN